MESLAPLLVGKPLNIAAVALVFLAAWLVARVLAAGQRRGGVLLAAALAWGAYAAWEWWVLVRTPEANIRVDLLLLWPVLAALSAWAVVRAVRPR